MDHHTIVTNIAVFREHVVDLGFMKFSHHLIGFGCSCCLNRVEIGKRCRIVTGLVHRWHFARLGKITLTKRARRIVQIPIPTGRKIKALRRIQSKRVNIGNEGEQSSRLHRC